MNTPVIRLIFAGIAIVLGGCVSAPQKAIQLGQDSFAPNTGRTGVAMTALPKVDTHLPGADCLLCLAVVAIANSSLTKHTQTLPYEDLPKLKSDVADLIRKQGADVIVIAEDVNIDALPDSDAGPDLPRKNFASLKKKYMIDKLLVIDIATLGMLRTYNAYFATSDPKAVLQGAAYMVDLEKNTYAWYLPMDVTRSSDGSWDEPPSFPGLTNAYFQVLEISKDNVLKPFTN